MTPGPDDISEDANETSDTVHTKETQQYVLYDDTTVPDVIYIGKPNVTNWDYKRLKTVKLIIPNFKILMLRMDGDLSIGKVKDLLQLKFHMPYINPVISVNNQALSEEMFSR